MPSAPKLLRLASSDRMSIHDIIDRSLATLSENLSALSKKQPSDHVLEGIAHVNAARVSMRKHAEAARAFDAVSENKNQPV